jgi:hypothetical protein
MLNAQHQMIAAQYSSNIYVPAAENFGNAVLAYRAVSRQQTTSRQLSCHTKQASHVLTDPLYEFIFT